MSDLGLKFLAAALGQDGAKALRKAVEREPALAEVLIPRTIVGWLNFTTEHEYEGPIPGVENSYVQFQKNEDGFAGTISLEEGVYSFEKSSVYHLAASIALALGLQPSSLDADVRDQILVKLGKSIDTLAKAQVLMQELKTPGALKPTRMTTHGAYHVEHTGVADRPYSVIHTRTGSPVQTGISSLKDAQPIADWHQNRYGGVFKVELSKKVIDPGAGYTFSHKHDSIGGGEHFTQVHVHDKAGNVVGQAGFEHHDGQPHAKLDIIHVHPDHRRLGIGSAMMAHATKVLGKPVMSTTARTDMGEKFWQASKPALGKVELPGRSHQPTAQQGPQAPTPPMKQPQQAAKPTKTKLPNLSIGKSEAEQECRMCGGHQFENNRFKGCICFRDLSKHVSTTAYGDGYVLTFKPGMDAESVKALMKTFRSK